MVDAPKPATGFLNTPIRNKNRVAESIKAVAAAKRGGAFTFQVGRADRVVNLAMGCAVLFALANAGVGIHKMANGYGKKEGF
jgi:hypothetical protein